MQMERFAERLRAQLAAVANGGSDETRALAERMSVALEPAVRLALLEALSEAAGEISRELAPDGVDLRLRGQEAEFVVTRRGAVAPPASAPSANAARAEPAEEEPASFRTTLRLPERVKSRVELAAATDGVSVNTWLVRAVSAALESGHPPAAAQNGRFTGWVR